MKRIKILSVLIAGLLCFTLLPSCEKVIGKGAPVTERRDVTGFGALLIGIPAASYFTQSSHFLVEITAQQNILDEIGTVIIGNELKIRFRDPALRISTSEGIIVRVEAPDLNSITVDGSGHLQVNPLTGGALKLLVSGSGSLRADSLGVSNIDATLSGSGSLFVQKGRANENVVHVSGSGYANLEGVPVQDADTYISGSGAISVNASNTLKAHISGSGTVFYYGNPTVISSISGSGRVVKL